MKRSGSSSSMWLYACQMQVKEVEGLFHLAPPLFSEHLEAWPCQLYLLGQHVDEVCAQSRCAVSICTLQTEVHSPAHATLRLTLSWMSQHELAKVQIPLLSTTVCRLDNVSNPSSDAVHACRHLLYPRSLHLVLCCDQPLSGFHLGFCCALLSVLYLCKQQPCVDTAVHNIVSC